MDNFVKNLKKKKIFHGQNFRFFGVSGSIQGTITFLRSVANFKFFMRVRALHGLSFKPIKYLLAACRHMFKVEKRLRTRETAPPGVQKIFLNIFFATSGINK